MIVWASFGRVGPTGGAGVVIFHTNSEEMEPINPESGEGTEYEYAWPAGTRRKPEMREEEVLAGAE